MVILATKNHKHVFVFRNGRGKRWGRMSEREFQKYVKESLDGELLLEKGFQGKCLHTAIST